MGKIQISRRDFWPVLALASYDFWLLAFPLQGYFLLRLGKVSHFVCFILPHTLSLFFLAWRGYYLPLAYLSFGAGILTAILTTLYPLLPSSLKAYAMISLGPLSALLVIRVGCLLKNSRNPVIASALGLILGNIFLFFSLLWNPPQIVLFPLMGLLILSSLQGSLYRYRQESLRDLWPYLPFIFLFYLLIGLFYVCLMPLYLKEARYYGGELFFYIAAILISAYLFYQQPDYLLALGIGMGILAVTFLHYLNPLTTNLAMYAIQAAAGFMDIFCLGLYLKGRDTLRRFSLGAGFMLLGPALGFPLLYEDRWPFIIGIAGNIILGMGLLAFYFLVSSKTKYPFSSPIDTFPEEKLLEACHRVGISRETFSSREWEILKLALTRKSVKEIASHLGLAESSVKTYLQRIYQKTGVKSKRMLIQKFISES